MSIDPRVEALIRQGVNPAAQPQQQQLMVNVTGPDGSTQTVPVELAAVMLLSAIAEHLAVLRNALAPGSVEENQT